MSVLNFNCFTKLYNIEGSKQSMITIEDIYYNDKPQEKKTHIHIESEIIEDEYEELDIKISKLRKKDDKKIIFAIDNDECIGSWADLSLLYLMLKREYGIEPEINMFVEIVEKTFCIRPYVRNFYDKLIKLKQSDIIHKIYMFTAASNSDGWVSYLCKVIEKWYGQPIYDGIINQEMIIEWHIKNKSNIFNNVGYIKNMHMISHFFGLCKKKYHFIAIDDRPNNIINGDVIGVTPYKVAVNMITVVELFMPKNSEYLKRKYDSSLTESWNDYKMNNKAFTNASLDIDFLTSLEKIDKIILSLYTAK